MPSRPGSIRSRTTRSVVGAQGEAFAADAVGGDRDAIALRFESPRQEVGDPCLVLDDQDLHGGDAKPRGDPCRSRFLKNALKPFGTMDWSLLHTLNDFLFQHDQVEDPLLFYVNASEALFVATLAVVFLLAHGRRHLDWRRATVAAVLSAGLGLARRQGDFGTGRSGPPVRRRSPRRPPVLGPRRRPRLPQRPCDGRIRDRDGDRAAQAASRISSPWSPPRCSRSAGSLSASTTRATSLRAPRSAPRRRSPSGRRPPAAGSTPSPTSSAGAGTGHWAGAPFAAGIAWRP